MLREPFPSNQTSEIMQSANGYEVKDSNAVTVDGPISVHEPSVFRGDVPFLSFHVGEKVIGKLWGTGGRLSFEGDADESAKVFFDNVVKLNSHLFCE